MAQRALSDLLEAAFLRSRDLQAPLAERLRAFAEEVRPTNPRFSDAVDALIGRLAESGAGSAAPKVGEPLPPSPPEPAAASDPLTIGPRNSTATSSPLSTPETSSKPADCRISPSR